MMKPYIDMVCFNQECIRKGNQLFIYESQQRLIHQNHADDDCVNLHPHNFKRKYVSQSSIIQDLRHKFQSSLSGNIKQTIDSISCMLKEMLSKQIMKTYDKAMMEFQAINCHSMLEKIKTNNNIQYELMIMNNLFLQNKEEIKKIIGKKGQKCRTEVISNLKQLNHFIRCQLQKLIPQFQPSNLNTIQQQQGRQILLPTSQPVKLQLEEPQHFSEIEQSHSDRMILQPNQTDKENENTNRQNISQSNQQLSLSDIRKYFKNTKTKQIKRLNNFQKIDRMMNLFQYNPSHRQSKFTHANKNSTNQSTYIIRSEADLIQVQSKQFNVKRLVIYHNVEQQDLLKVIRNKSPQEVFLNFPHKFSSNFIRNIPQPILIQLQRFQEFWDHDQFFDERINRQFFPTDDFRHIKIVNKIHLTSKNLNNLSKLTNIWISNHFDFQQLKLSKKKASDIKSLRIEVCKCCNDLNQNTISQILLYFKYIDSLKTFVLKCEKLNSYNLLLLKQVTKKNNKIQCIAIEIEGKMIPRQMLQCFSHLPLTKLSINNERCNKRNNVYMDITPITQIKSLKKLAMTNIFFTTKQPKEREIDQSEYIELDEEASNKISSLPNLVFIDLFRCSPIYPSLVAQLSEQSQSNLYHLDLSHTCMDQTLIPELYNLPKLKQLNLDRTILALKDLFKELLKKPLYNIEKLSLFHYNGDKLDDVDQIRDFISQIQFSSIKDQQIQKISVCFPNLEYLNIAFCHQFNDLPQLKFKKLKYLCSNKQYMTPAKIEKLKHHRGIEVYLYDGKYPAWIVPVKQKK